MPTTIDSVRQLSTSDCLNSDLATSGLVEVQGARVHRQQGKPGIVAFGDGSAGAVLVHVADVKIIILATEAFAVALGTDLFAALHGITPKLRYS